MIFPMLRTALSGTGLYVAAGALLLGMAVGGSTGVWLAHKLTEGRALRAERTLADYKTEMANAVALSAVAQVAIRDDVRRSYDEAKSKIDVLAGDLRLLRRDVRVCASTSSMPVPGPTPGAGEARPDGQPRPADAVLQELAAFIAKRADQQAAQQNALIDWANKTAGSSGEPSGSVSGRIVR